MRKTLYITAALAAPVAIAAAIGWRAPFPTAPAADARLPGLAATVEVWRDSLSVPHLWARDELDLARALGYVHAQDRLWQMELFRRAGDGRLAELLGPEALSSDRFLRTIGIGRAAGDEERALDAQSRARLQAYADGVNAWAGENAAALPPELLLLRVRLEPWTVRNSLTVSKMLSWDLADWQIGLDLQRAVDRVGAERARDLLPRYPDWGARIIAAPASRSGAPDARPLPPVAHPPLPAIPELAGRLLGAASATSGSNSWVIAGSRTRSGKPILANDPHLELRTPSLWYLAALHGGPTNVAGVTIPGLPVVIIGHTERVAWGFTNAMVDDVDFFVERVDPADSSRYQTPDGWQRFEVRAETIQVRGAAPSMLRVRRTRHGPVVSPLDARAGDRVLAMQWTAHRPSTAFAAMAAMNRAQSADALVAALRSLDEPHQNVVFADVEGTIGYWMAGRVPIRRSGDGLLPLEGWTGAGDWTGFLSFDQHPHAIDPAEGFIVTANNAPGGDYPHHLGSLYEEPFRAARIRELLREGSSLTADDVARQQMDVRDAFAQRYLPTAIRAAEAVRDSTVARDLRAWNGEARPDSRAAAIFYLWYEQLRGHVGADEYGGRFVFFPRYSLNRILESGGGAWVDDVRTQRVETLAQMSAASMREAIAMVGDRNWGDLHTTRIAHTLGSVDLIARTLNLNIPAFPAAGSHSTVNVAGYGRVLPFVNTHGASMRQVVDLADPGGSGGFILPTGQSGIPSSLHYRDQTAAWRAGRLSPIALDRARAERAAVSRVTLEP